MYSKTYTLLSYFAQRTFKSLCSRQIGVPYAVEGGGGSEAGPGREGPVYPRLGATGICRVTSRLTM